MAQVSRYGKFVSSGICKGVDIIQWEDRIGFLGGSAALGMKPAMNAAPPHEGSDDGSMMMAASNGIEAI